MLGALAVELDVIFVDAGRHPPPIAPDRLLLVVAADVRGVASARMLADQHSLSLTGMVLRADVLAAAQTTENAGDVQDLSQAQAVIAAAATRTLARTASHMPR